MMKIGELSKVLGCSIQTIRYYEKEGLVTRPCRSEGNFRIYNNDALKELEFVKHCRSLDIPLFDIKKLIELKQNPEGSCSSVNNLIEEQLELVKQRMAELKVLKRELHKISNSCRVDNTIDQCGILKSLDE